MEIQNQEIKRVYLTNRDDLSYITESLDANIELVERIKRDAEGVSFSLRRLKESIERVMDSE